MIAAEPARSLLNPAFQLKMVLLVTALALTAATGRPLRHSPDYWGASRLAQPGGPLLRHRLHRAVGGHPLRWPVDCVHGCPLSDARWVQPVTGWLEWLYATGWANAIRENEIAFPWIECVHVLAITLVVGSISVVDLRLLGVAWRDRSVQRVLRDVLPLTWAAFALAVASGFLLFASNAPAYARNPYLQAKMALLVLAGLNMASFHWWARRSLEDVGQRPAASLARAAGRRRLLAVLARRGRRRPLDWLHHAGALKIPHGLPRRGPRWCPLRAPRGRLLAWPKEGNEMAKPFVSRGFVGKRRAPGLAGRVPPGQYVTTDFPVLSAGPTPRTPLERWSFSIEGLVGKPARFELGGIPQASQRDLRRRHPLRHQVEQVGHPLGRRQSRHPLRAR